MRHNSMMAAPSYMKIHRQWQQKIMRHIVVPTLTILGLSLSAFPVQAAGEYVTPPDQDWSFEGFFGHYERDELQRGFHIYREVCASCHGLRLVSFRHLEGIGFTEDEVKALAASYQVEDGPDDSGEMFTRPGIPADRIPDPFANEQQARAMNGGAMPVDLSVIAQARPYGPDYLYAYLIGYEDPPADFDLPAGSHYNRYFPGHQVKMPQVLFEEGVSYHDGTPATIEQQAHDVTAFLMWAAEPHLETRKQMGFNVMLFLLAFAVFAYLAKRRIWAKLHQEDH